MTKSSGVVTFPSVGGKSKGGALDEKILEELRTRLTRELETTLIVPLKSQYLPKELQFQLQCAPDTTSSTTFVDVANSLAEIKMSDWLYYSMYLEVIGKTTANTAEFRLYNITDGSSVSVGQISTSSTSTTLIRSSAVTKPTIGNKKEFKLQFRMIGAGTATAFTSRIVFRLNN